MPTVALVAWSKALPPLDAQAQRAITASGGRLELAASLAVFSGVGEALAGAVALQQQTGGVRVVAMTLDDVAGGDPATDVAATAKLRELLASGEPGDILATEVVRLLRPIPETGSWDDRAAAGLPGISRLRWQPQVETNTISVVVAEDVALIRAGIVSLLTGDGFAVVGQAADYDSVLNTTRRTRPDLLVTDIRMPPGQRDEGLRAAAVLRSEQPELAVLVLSQHVQASAAAQLLTDRSAGIGYLLKERVTAFEEFLAAARTVAGGGIVIDPLIGRQLLDRRRDSNRLDALADREREVLELMAQGLSNAAIAGRLVLSERTVEAHVRSILTKLDISDDPAGNRRVQAVIRWLDQH